MSNRVWLPVPETKWIYFLPDMLNTLHDCFFFGGGGGGGITTVHNVEILRITITPKSYLWLRDEGPSGDGEAVVDCAEILGHDGKTAPLFATGAGSQPLDEEDNNCKWVMHIHMVRETGLPLRSYNVALSTTTHLAANKTQEDKNWNKWGLTAVKIRFDAS